MRNDKEARSALNISIFHYLNLFIFSSAQSVTFGSILPFFQYLNLSWVNQLLVFLAEKSSLIYKVYKEND